jgi:CYTH domain-containing protein
MSHSFGHYARREYERRWLLGALPPALDPQRPWSRISDLYIDNTRFRVRERIRLSDNDIVWKLTQKFPETDGAFDRIVITNSYLTRAEYETFLRLPGRRLMKNRWLLEFAGACYGVDAYQENLAGLITAEREFSSYDALVAAARESLPFEEAIEVTSRIEFTGGALAGTSFAELAATIAAQPCLSTKHKST